MRIKEWEFYSGYTDEMTDILKPGELYRGIYPDGREYIFKYSHTVDGDHIGDGFCCESEAGNYEYTSGAAFCAEHDVVVKATMDDVRIFTESFSYVR